MHFFELILALKRKCLATEEQAREELGLSPAEFNALLCVDSEEKITGHCFSLRAGLSPSRASRVQWRLISRKLLRSSADRNDRRNKLISLTPDGVARYFSGITGAIPGHARMNTIKSFPVTIQVA